MKFLLNKQFILLGLLAVFISGVISTLADEGDFQASLKKTSQSISISIVEHDDLNIQRTIDHLQSQYSRQVTLRTAENKFFATSGTSAERCVINRDLRVEYLGLQVASVESCTSLRALLTSAFASKTFFLIFCMIQLFGLVYLTVSKTTTEKNLLQLIEDLESSHAVIVEHQKSDLLFSKIRNLIKDREDANRMARESQLQTENEMRISDLSRKVAHDIRSPLTALHFAVACASHLDENVRSLIVAAADRISGIANDLLDSSRQIKSPDLFDPLEALKILANEFHGSSEVIIVQGSPDASSIKCDKMKFERTLVNIIQNSIDASSKKVDVTVLSTADSCKIVISDEGNGFHDQVLKNVGARGLSLGKTNGNGIGLSSAYSFMQELGGSLEISNTAIGARVCLSFPN